VSGSRPFVRPRALRPGDRVALLSLASPARPEDVEAAADELRGLGFEPVLPPPADGGAPYVAGTAEARALQLRACLRDERLAAVVATRGGYGSAQLLPWLDVAEIRDRRLLLIGYSDLTALLDLWTGHAGVVSVHGPMAEGRLARGPVAYDRDSFMRTVCEPRPPGVVHAPNARVLQAGVAGGTLRGGTLTQLTALLGTPWAFMAREDSLLFLDDVNERPYRLDRMLFQLRHAGALDHVRGVVLNELPGCDEPGGALAGCDAVMHALAGFAGPIVAGIPSGHTAGRMITLPLGVAASLTAAETVTLAIIEPAVA
jgi:muramoyltetrapeptide carboxypeptidase